MRFKQAFFAMFRAAGSKSLALLVFPAMFFALSQCATVEEKEAEFGSNPPIIATAFAKKKIQTGDTWRIYINAFDPDGDMKLILVSSLLQEGGDPYPFSTVKIPKESGDQLSGYVYLTTSPFEDLWNVHLDLTMNIVDRAGHMSLPQHFELTFSHKASEVEPDPELFTDRSLGPISIDLINPGLFDASGGGTPEP